MKRINSSASSAHVTAATSRDGHGRNSLLREKTVDHRDISAELSNDATFVDELASEFIKLLVDAISSSDDGPRQLKALDAESHARFLYLTEDHPFFATF